LVACKIWTNMLKRGEGWGASQQVAGFL
jgi:hypothetical protein